ncbi:hypothetical protein GBF38_013300, partial [Nibea albiflora]
RYYLCSVSSGIFFPSLLDSKGLVREERNG